MMPACYTLPIVSDPRSGEPGRSAVESRMRTSLIAPLSLAVVSCRMRSLLVGGCTFVALGIPRVVSGQTSRTWLESVTRAPGIGSGGRPKIELACDNASFRVRPDSVVLVGGKYADSPRLYVWSGPGGSE